MADILLSNEPSPSRLGALRDWLRQARVAATLTRPAPQSLPDHLLRDIGVEPAEWNAATGGRAGPLAAQGIDQPTRLGLLDLGWQPPRPPRRR
ncbi:MAG TPA: hypothetical protein GX405_11065 [Rhizobiales bacterium]|nr:hypothetical protein [Hyphomicrobiales bacterium]